MAWLVAQTLAGSVLLTIIGRKAYPVLASIGYLPKGWNLDVVTVADIAKAGFFVLAVCVVIAWTTTYAMRRVWPRHTPVRSIQFVAWFVAELVGSVAAVLLYSQTLVIERTYLVFLPESQLQFWALSSALFIGTILGAFPNVVCPTTQDVVSTQREMESRRSPLV